MIEFGREIIRHGIAAFVSREIQKRLDALARSGRKDRLFRIQKASVFEDGNSAAAYGSRLVGRERDVGVTIKRDFISQP